MNDFTWKIDGKQKNLKTPYDEEMTKIQVQEIFVEEQYKAGLDYLKSLKEPGVVLDVGGCMGLSAIYFKDYAKRIISFEPSSISYECFKHNTKDYPNIEVHREAVADREATGKLFANDQGQIPDSMFGNQGDRFEVVNGKGIDQLFEENKIDHVDLMKIDCEGGEYIIFPSRAFAKVAPKIDVIVGESHFFGEIMPYFLPEILKEHGFDKFEWLPYENVFKMFHYTDLDTKEIKSYKVNFATTFVASKSKNDSTK